MKAHIVPEAPNVKKTTPPTPPQTASIAGNPTVNPSTAAQGLPQKNAEETKAAATDAQAIAEGSLIFSTPPIRSLCKSITDSLRRIAFAKSF